MPSDSQGSTSAAMGVMHTTRKSCIQQTVSHTAVLLAYLQDINIPFSCEDASRPKTLTVAIAIYNVHVDNIRTNVVYTQGPIHNH